MAIILRERILSTHTHHPITTHRISPASCYTITDVKASNKSPNFDATFVKRPGDYMYRWLVSGWYPLILVFQNITSRMQVFLKYCQTGRKDYKGYDSFPQSFLVCEASETASSNALHILTFQRALEIVSVHVIRLYGGYFEILFE